MNAATTNYKKLNDEIAAHDARLVAVSKTHPNERILELYELGHRCFGENRVGEFTAKVASLPNDIEWHFIGHLQRNKVKDVVAHVDLIHSGDSARLIREVDKRASAIDRRVRILLQFHIAEEESKYGLTRKTAEEFLNELDETPLTHAAIVGVMGMATYTDDTEQIDAEFRKLYELFSWCKATYFPDNPTFREISMGMSGDYKIALKRGSTLVRVGSLLFGARDN